MNTHEQTRLSRRAFVQAGTLCLAAPPFSFSAPRKPLRIGLITDLHYADKPAAGTRHYRDTPAKLAEAAEQFRKGRPEFLVELGDFIDAADSVQRELSYLKRINRDFAVISKKRHYVLGNHCVHTLTKSEFLGAIERPKSWYSFDEAGLHFVVLDSCFRSDGKPYERSNFEWTDPNIPEVQLEWLKGDLAKTKHPTIVFAHQRLDVAPHYHVRNAPAVRKILEESGQVAAVFQGHSHQNAYQEIGGIHYCTLVAMVEGSGTGNSAFSILTALPDGSLQVQGFVKQKTYRWPA